MIDWKNTEKELPKDKSYTGEIPKKFLIILYGQYVHEAYFLGEEGWQVDDDYYKIEDGDVTHWAEFNMP